MLFTKLPEYLTQPVMHCFEDSRVFVQRGGRQAGQRRHGVIDPGVTRFGRDVTRPFCIHEFDCPPGTVTVRENGTVHHGVRH